MAQKSVAIATMAMCLMLLVGCVVAIPSSIILTEGVPRVINGKGLVEDGVDLATGKDCRLIEGLAREKREICETRGSAETTKDFKGLSGVGN